MLTRKQFSLYWIEWQQVLRAFAEADRHEVTLAALGYQKSHRELTNPELDKVLAEFRKYSRPADMTEQVRLARMTRRRLEHKITVIQSSLLEALFHAEHGDAARARAEGYILTIMRERFGTEDISSVRHTEAEARLAYVPTGLGYAGKSPRHESKTDLEQLRDTIKSRISKLRRAKGWDEHTLCQLAQVQCRCKECVIKQALLRRGRAAAEARPAIGGPALSPGAPGGSRPTSQPVGEPF